MNFRIVLFDLDGTLVNTGGAGLRAFDRAMADEFDPGMNLHVLKPAGMTDPAIFREIYLHNRGHPPSADEENRLFVRYLECLEEEVRDSKDFRVLPGVVELLEDLSNRNGFLLGLGTGNLEAGARIKLERAGLNKYFSFGGFGSDSSDRPELLKLAVERGICLAGGDPNPKAVIVVGDTPRDIVAGKSIGAMTLAVASGPYQKSELKACGPDLLVDSLLERRTIVEWLLV